MAVNRDGHYDFLLFLSCPDILFLNSKKDCFMCHMDLFDDDSLVEKLIAPLNIVVDSIFVPVVEKQWLVELYPHAKTRITGPRRVIEIEDASSFCNSESAPSKQQIAELLQEQQTDGQVLPFYCDVDSNFGLCWGVIIFKSSVELDKDRALEIQSVASDVLVPKIRVSCLKKEVDWLNDANLNLRRIALGLRSRTTTYKKMMLKSLEQGFELSRCAFIAQSEYTQNEWCIKLERGFTDEIRERSIYRRGDGLTGKTLLCKSDEFTESLDIENDVEASQ